MLHGLNASVRKGTVISGEERLLSMLAIWIGKLALWLLRLTGRGGTSLPGQVAMRVSPRVLYKLGRGLTRCIVVTGTNGKTTTSALLASALRTDGDLLTNAEGSNMQQGLVTALLRGVTWYGKMKTKTALLEIDEATLPRVVSALPIRVIVVTNVFRDQLDRYGELDTTVNKLLDGIALTDAVLVLNGDDPLARHIGLKSGRRAEYFGLSRSEVTRTPRDQIRDGAFCLNCGHRLRYDGFFYGQLGLYVCEHCDFCRPHPTFEGEPSSGQLNIRESQTPTYAIQLPVYGRFNAYNALAAIAAARVCGLSPDAIQEGLQHYHPPLGRMQVFPTTPTAVLNLIKNPTGCDTVIEAVIDDPGAKLVCIAINDQAADGRDVSWLWDADFEQLVESPHVRIIVTTGMRAEDMALRLKYAGCPTDRIRCIPDVARALAESLQAGQAADMKAVYVLSTYTALHPVAQVLQRSTTHHERPSTLHRTSVS